MQEQGGILFALQLQVQGPIGSPMAATQMCPPRVAGWLGDWDGGPKVASWSRKKHVFFHFKTSRKPLDAFFDLSLDSKQSMGKHTGSQKSVPFQSCAHPMPGIVSTTAGQAGCGPVWGFDWFSKVGLETRNQCCWCYLLLMQRNKPPEENHHASPALRLLPRQLAVFAEGQGFGFRSLGGNPGEAKVPRQVLTAKPFCGPKSVYSFFFAISVVLGRSILLPFLLCCFSFFLVSCWSCWVLLEGLFDFPPDQARQTGGLNMSAAEEDLK